MAKASIPISFPYFQRIMSQFGYKMSHVNHGRNEVIFKLENTSFNYPTPLTVILPDYTDGQGEYAYEKDYVVDLLKSLGDKDTSKSFFKAFRKDE